ncbi:MAG: hypothetical protein FGM27_06200 [Candidatus Omnitrophica bacterium]|nr:hypothetical protein [Candidatus Omnitrophota bacterium]
MKRYQPERVLLDSRAREWPLTGVILERLSGVPVEEVREVRPLIESLKNTRDPIGAGKRTLFLTVDEGRSFKPFPESEPYLSCDYFTLHVAEGCDLECSYCILQAYLTNPFLTVYVNVPEMLGNLERFLADHRERFFRIGTGQLSDSLSLDHITGFSEILTRFFSKQPNAVVELKTKSDNISRLLSLSSGGRTIVSWSLNRESVQKKEEHKTASLEERLAAAGKIARQTDHRVGFHFDPLVDSPGCESEYLAMIEKLFCEVPSEKIAWISLGCLRFMPELKPIMEERFPKSPLPAGEWIKGMDGKMRYFKPRRIELYAQLRDAIRSRAPGVTLYLSMESPEVWREVFGVEHSKESVCRMLDSAARAAKKDF